MTLIAKSTRDPKVTRWWWRTLRQWVYELVDPLWAAFRGENSADIALTNLTSINGVTATELDYLGGQIGPGIAVASRAIVLDANKDISGKRFDINRSLLDSVAGNGPCFRADGIDDYITLAGAGNQLAVTHGTVEIIFAAHDLNGSQFIYGVATPRVYISLSGTGLRITLGDNISHSIQNIVTETIYHVVLTWLDPDGDGDGSYTVYVNGVLADSGSYTGLTSIPANPTLASIGSSSWAHCSIFKHRGFNRVLASDEVAHYSSGIPVPFADIGASATAQTSGVLIVGKRYRIQTYVAGDDFTNLGASSNASGVEFVASATTPTVWSNASTLLRIGCVIQLEQDGIGANLWYDKSGNGLHGTVNGATAINLPIAYVNDAGRHLVEGLDSARNILRACRIRFEPGDTPGTNINISELQGSDHAFNQPTVNDATNLGKSGSSGSFSLNAAGTLVTMAIAESVIGVLSSAIVIHDINSSSQTDLYVVLARPIGNNMTIELNRGGSTTPSDLTAILNTGDICDVLICFVTNF